MLSPSKPKKKAAIQKGVMKLSEGVFMLPTTSRIHQKGPFSPAKISNELNMGVQRLLIQSPPFSQFKKSPLLPPSKYKSSQESKLKTTISGSKSSLTISKMSFKKLPNLVDPVNYKLNADDLFSFFNKDLATRNDNFTA